MSTFVIAVLLAWIAGFVDAVGFLALSHVFAAHMSGNTVAAGSDFGTGQWPEIFRRAFPIPMFVLGVFCGALMGEAMRRNKVRRRFMPSFVLETLLLGSFVGLTFGTDMAGTSSGWRSYSLVAILAIAMGLQNATLRRARGIAVRTTFITGMLVNMAERAAGFLMRAIDTHKAFRRTGVTNPRLLSARRREGAQAMRYALLWCGMFAGAVCGGCSEIWWGTAALLLPIAGLIGIIFYDFVRPLSES
jgi:uncharacterized membrane protein YoaK (UPF0700 family)